MRKILLVFKLVYILRFAQISDYIKYVPKGKRARRLEASVISRICRRPRKQIAPEPRNLLNPGAMSDISARSARVDLLQTAS